MTSILARLNLQIVQIWCEIGGLVLERWEFGIACGTVERVRKNLSRRILFDGLEVFFIVSSIVYDFGKKKTLQWDFRSNLSP